MRRIQTSARVQNEDGVQWREEATAEAVMLNIKKEEFESRTFLSRTILHSELVHHIRSSKVGDIVRESQSLISVNVVNICPKILLDLLAREQT